MKNESFLLDDMKNAGILLRPWLESDAEVLFKYASDPEVDPEQGRDTPIRVLRLEL